MKFDNLHFAYFFLKSPLTRGEWIEIAINNHTSHTIQSPLTRGEWIEIKQVDETYIKSESPLTRGEWIEISVDALTCIKCLVSPHSRGVD